MSCFVQKRGEVPRERSLAVDDSVEVVGWCNRA